MPKVTLTSGVEVIFDADAISMVIAADAETGEPVTCVYGVLSAAMKIGPKPDDFLNQLGIRSKFCTLTRPDGSPVWIKGGAVSYLMPPAADDYPAAVKTLVGIGSGQGVTEDPATAKAVINRTRDPSSQL